MLVKVTGIIPISGSNEVTKTKKLCNWYYFPLDKLEKNVK